MTVPEQPSPRFEINPLPARGDPAGWEGRSPPPRRPSRPRPRAPIGASRPEPPANQAAGTALGARLRRGVGGKVQQLFFFSFPPRPPGPEHPLPWLQLGNEVWPSRGTRAETRAPALPPGSDALTCPGDPGRDHCPLHLPRALPRCPPPAPRLPETGV